MAPTRRRAAAVAGAKPAAPLSGGTCEGIEEGVEPVRVVDPAEEVPLMGALVELGAKVVVELKASMVVAGSVGSAEASVSVSVSVAVGEATGGSDVKAPLALLSVAQSSREAPSAQQTVLLSVS